MHRLLWLRWLTSLLLVAGYVSSAQAQLHITEAYVRGLPPGQTVTAAFMRVHNGGDKPVVIVAASTDSAQRAEIHTHLYRDGKMRMEQVERVPVPAGADLVMKPGGYHLMLIGLHKPLQGGDKVNIRLLTHDGRSISAQLPVRSVLHEHKHHH